MAKNANTLIDNETLIANLHLLRNRDTKEISGALPVFLSQVVELAKITIKPDRIILFGSRARGDASKFSDFDLAFEGVRDEPAWIKFCVDLEDEAETLRDFDLVRLETAHDDLKQHIEKWGIAIYVRKD